MTAVTTAVQCAGSRLEFYQTLSTLSVHSAILCVFGSDALVGVFRSTVCRRTSL